MEKRKKISGLQRAEEKTAWVMLAPNTIGLLVFVFVPIIAALYISFHSWNGLTEMKFLGLRNFRKLLTDREFKGSLLTTLRYCLTYVPSLYVLSLAFALMVNSLFKVQQQIFRTLIFLPYCISTVISGLVWGFLLDPLNGYVNQMLRWAGFESQLFFGSQTQALNSIVVTSVWIQVGYNMVILLAAIKDIPRDYYEAASIDGAGTFQKFWRITLPHLGNASSFVLVTSTINSFQVFDQVKLMTNGGPNRATNVTVYYIFRQAFDQNKIGYASAIAFVLFLILMIFSLLQLKLIRSDEG